MRKSVKASILEIIGTLYDAHDSIRSMIEKHDSDSVLSLLEDCQNTAVEIGSVIENSEGEGFCTIHLLEDYCETVYNVSIGIAENLFGAKAKKMLDKSLLKAENSVKNDISVRLEIVFMPYKASMWDSLESVWKAANDDPDCDSYVVPIPYYERNPDHSFGKYHYEGRDYPEYVPVVHYENYDLERRMPDVIYIHNPYDSYNYVTSVDPRYYSSELKKYTGCLVYIPYFYTGGEFPSSQTFIPTYNNYNFIIVQGKKAVQDISVSEDKLLILGSPKLDCVLNVSANINKPQWISMLKGRTPVMLNTGITSFLNNEESFFKKLKYIFNWCEYHQEVIIIWRPHPLLYNTIKTMRPYLFDLYRSMIQKFKDNELGIYDDTPCPETTVSICKAYLGDYSSVIHLFGVVGKPIFIFNNDIVEKPSPDDCQCLNIGKLSVSYENGVFWCISQNNYLCKVNSLNGTVTPIQNLHFIGEPYQYNYAFEYKDFIFLSPNSSNRICIINKTDNRIDYIELPNELSSITMKFSDVISFGTIIYFIPFNFPYIVKYDTTNNSVTYLHPHTLFEVNHSTDLFFPYASIIYEKRIVLNTNIDDILLFFDFEKEKFFTRKITGLNCKYVMVEFEDNNSLWLIAESQDTLISYNLANNEIKSYKFDLSQINYNLDIYPAEFEGVRYIWKKIIVRKDYVLLFPNCADCIIRFNKHTHVFEYMEKGNKYISCCRKNSYHNEISNTFGFVCEDNIITFVSGFNNSIVHFNVDMGIQSIIPCRINEDALEAIRKQAFGKCEKGYPFASFESSLWSIDDFINNSVISKYKYSEEQKAAYSKVIENCDGTCGYKIHQSIVSYVKGNT